jgi:hypothetical protein
MRRVVLSALAAVALLAGSSACASSASSRGLLPVALSAAPLVTPHPAVNRRVCHDATKAVLGVTRSFNAELDAIDRAAAKGDHVAIVTAADTIQTRLLALAGSFATWARRPVEASLRRALNGGAATLQAVCAETYSGNQADIARQLGGLSRALTRACG